MTDPTSRQKDKTVTLKKNLWSNVPDLGLTPRHRPTARQSQCDFEFDFDFEKTQ
jgi:hypothetical protein